MGKEGYGRMAEDTLFSFEQGPNLYQKWTLPGRLWVGSNQSHERRIVYLIMIRLLDYIITKCEELKEYLIVRSLPKGESASEWAKKNAKRTKNSYK